MTAMTIGRVWGMTNRFIDFSSLTHFVPKKKLRSIFKTFQRFVIENVASLILSGFKVQQFKMQLFLFVQLQKPKIYYFCKDPKINFIFHQKILVFTIIKKFENLQKVKRVLLKLITQSCFSSKHRKMTGTYF